MSIMILTRKPKRQSRYCSLLCFPYFLIYAFSNMNTRILLFLFACVPIRLLLVYAITVVSRDLLRVMAVGALIISLGFTVIFIGGFRKTGIETGGKPIWWNMLRPFHASMYAGVAYYAWVGNRSVASRLLLLDIFVGLIGFIAYHTKALPKL